MIDHDKDGDEDHGLGGDRGHKWSKWSQHPPPRQSRDLLPHRTMVTHQCLRVDQALNSYCVETQIIESNCDSISTIV